MEIRKIDLMEPWDGKNYVVLHSSKGFDVHATRFKQGLIIGDSFAFFFNERDKVNKEIIFKITELLLEDEHKKEQDKRK